MADERRLVVRDRQSVVDPHAGAESSGFNWVAGDIAMNSSNGDDGNGPIVVFPGDRQGPTEQEPARQFYIHAPQYHWHMEGGHDAMARQAIEQLDQQTFRFGRYMEDRLMRMARDDEGLGGNQLYLRAQLEKEQEDQKLL